MTMDYVKPIIFSLLVSFCALLFFLFKIEACKSKPEDCKEIFIDSQHLTSSNWNDCPKGARMEPVDAPKQGIICRCDHAPDGGK